jgi:hypothetical protein
MIKTVLLTILISVLHLQALSQRWSGTWYMITRSGLVEMNISNGSFQTRELTSDFVPKEKTGNSKLVIKPVELTDRILLICHSEKDTAKFSAITLFGMKERKYFQMAWNVKDTATKYIDTLVALNKRDTPPLFGYFVFSEHYIYTLKKLKNPVNMDLAGFKNYITVYANKLNSTYKEFEKYDIGYGFSYYNFQLITQSLFETGFNPIQTVTTIEAIYKKYYEDPEVKEILSKLKLQ